MITTGKGHLGKQDGVIAPTHASGSVAVQYVIKLTLIMIVAMSAAGSLGSRISDIFVNVATAIS